MSNYTSGYVVNGVPSVLTFQSEDGKTMEFIPGDSHIFGCLTENLGPSTRATIYPLKDEWFMQTKFGSFTLKNRTIFPADSLYEFIAKDRNANRYDCQIKHLIAPDWLPADWGSPTPPTTETVGKFTFFRCWHHGGGSDIVAHVSTPFGCFDWIETRKSIDNRLHESVLLESWKGYSPYREIQFLQEFEGTIGEICGKNVIIPDR